MNYLSVCSGIEAASVAWHPLGFTPFGFAEIEAFPSSVLAHHYGSNLPGEPWSGNAPPNFGDMTKFKDWPDATLDVLVGGTPCQSFSVAGLRGGLADPRGNLCLTFLAVADKYRPEWVLWENVPGVLSSNGGRDFGSFLGGLGQLGYGWAYWVLDAQYIRVDGFARAVPQRRRRVFVVGCAGDWRRAAAVLFERESLQGNPAPRRQAGKDVAPTISSRPTGGGGLGTDFDCDGGLVARSLNAHANRSDGESETFVAHALRADGFDASEDGTGRGTRVIPVNLQIATRHEALGRGTGFGFGEVGDPAYTLSKAHQRAIAFSAKDHGADAMVGCSPTLRAGGFTTSHANAGVMPAIAFQPRFARNGRGAPDEVAAPLTAEAGRTGKGDSAQCVAFMENVRGELRTGEVTDALSRGGGKPGQGYAAALIGGWAVRRLTPRECERLQGFPDGYTAVPYRNKPAADGPRYKALGNSMAVNAMRWLGGRIKFVKSLPISHAAKDNDR